MNSKEYIIVKIAIKLFDIKEYIIDFDNKRSVFAQDAKKHVLLSKKYAIILKTLLYNSKNYTLLLSLNKSGNCEIQIYHYEIQFGKSHGNYQDE